MAQPQAFDVVVIGAGPGGYIAAIRAAQLGFRDRVHRRLDARGRQAGAGRHMHERRLHSVEGAAAIDRKITRTPGMRSPSTASASTGLSMDVGRMLARKDKVVAQNNDGIAVSLSSKNRIAFFHGTRRVRRQGRRRLAHRRRRAGCRDARRARHVIIATGSTPRALPGVPFDNVRVLDNAGALAIPDVPKRLGVVGAGVVGLEMGSVWRRLGAEVTILEALPAFLGAADEAVAKEALKAFAKQGLVDQARRRRSARCASGKDDVGVDYTDAAGAAQTATFDRLIVSIGRVPLTAGLGADAVGSASSMRAASSTSTPNAGRTSPNVWAIGDVVRGPMLAHKAEDEGIAVAERIAGQHGHVDFNTIPWVIYTSPEIAWVGKTEQQLKAARRRLPRRQLSVLGERPRARARRHDGLRQVRRRRDDRPHPRHARHRPAGRAS